VSIVDWFDHKQLQHLQAYQYLKETGLWPKFFIPAEIGFPVGWESSLAIKLADIFVDEKIKQLTGKTLR
jgi:hypothetical protein